MTLSGYCYLTPNQVALFYFVEPWLEVLCRLVMSGLEKP